MGSSRERALWPWQPFPMATSLWVGRFLHMLFAAGLGVGGINYTFRASELASGRGDDTLALLCFVCFFVACVGAGIMLCTVYLAAMATEKLEKHAEGSQVLTDKEIQMKRIREMLLGVGQITVGMMLGIVLVIAAVEVGDTDNGQGSLLAGLVASLCGLFVVAVVYYMNDYFYNLCQNKPKEDDASEVVEDESAGEIRDVAPE